MKKQLNNAQKKAIAHFRGTCLVLAGPGSGKTTVITCRTRFLIERYQVNPADILVITFTRAAAGEMRQRFETMMGCRDLPVSFGTFHAVFFKILKYAYHYQADNIIKEEEKYQILKDLAEKNQLEMEDEKELIPALIAEIGSVKGDMMDLDHYYSSNLSDDVFRNLFRQYERILRQKNKIDFDDMLVLCYELLTKRKDILALWQRKFRFILIDEFQDINRVQYEIMKLLAAPENNLFIVGDDDQSVYRFRGARPEIMLNFEKDYPEAVRILLDENYRCSGNIVKASNHLILHNKKRFDKQIRTGNEDGEPVEYRIFQNRSEESQFIISQIREYVGQGGRYGDNAILFRTSLEPRYLVGQLMEYHIPFHMKDMIPNIYDHFIAKDLISYIRFACGSRSRTDFLRLVNKPNRYISREILREEAVDPDRLMKYYQDKPWMIERLEQLKFHLRRIRMMAPFAAINYICQGIGYEEYLEEYAGYRKMDPQELFDIRDEILQASKDYTNFDDWFQYMEQYGEELKKQTEINRFGDDAVELSTMHSAKGLEYDRVYLIEAIEGVTPHSKAVLEEDQEEERRLFYVAVTRARKKLMVCSIRERFGKETEVSRFVKEMKNEKKYTKGNGRRNL